jgi:putative spermidine/putrescine transport system ATP-binding protein
MSSPMSKTAALSLRGLTKRFGAVTAADDVTLDVGEGEFFAMLGPSGSGKTTALRMIAGFEKPDAGTISLSGVDITNDAPFDRDVNTVFQDYALFPHLSVIENVEYGLMVTKVPRPERRRRADEMLEAVRLGGYGERVALARALVNEPKVLLLDEPLGALDLKLREEMQVELKSIQQRVGITFVFVTHDQGEALSMSDRIAVFNQGRVEQVGTPREIYERPSTAFVASFVGSTNLVSGERAMRLFGRSGTFTLRPEHVEVGLDGGGIEAVVQTVQFLGADTRLHCALEDGTNLVASGVSARLGGITAGSKVRLSWNSGAAFAVSDR